MADLAKVWKAAKTQAEGEVKKAEGQKKKAAMPKFKQDFQKGLNTLDKAWSAVLEQQKKLAKALEIAKKQAQACDSVASDYQTAIEQGKSDFDGPDTRSKVQTPMKTALNSIRSTLTKREAKMNKLIQAVATK